MFRHFLEYLSVIPEKLLELFLAFLVNFHIHNYTGHIFKAFSVCDAK